jgi:hypothetical protein
MHRNQVAVLDVCREIHEGQVPDGGIATVSIPT